MKTVKLTYFKPSGKYYCEGEYQSEQKFDFNIYPEVGQWGFGIANRGSLPGLSSTQWNGYILVNIVDGVPALVDCRVRE